MKKRIDIEKLFLKKLVNIFNDEKYCINCDDVISRERRGLLCAKCQTKKLEMSTVAKTGLSLGWTGMEDYIKQCKLSESIHAGN